MQNKRFIVISEIVAGLIIMVIMTSFTEQAFVYFQMSRKMGYNLAEIVKSVIPILLGISAFFLLYVNVQVNTFLNDVYHEVSKVSWPSKQELQVSTISVLIAVLILGFVLGFFDFLVVKLMNTIFQ